VVNQQRWAMATALLQAVQRQVRASIRSETQMTDQ